MLEALGMPRRDIQLTCCDCGHCYTAQNYNGRSKRCVPCQRVYVNAATCRRDKARRERGQAAKRASSVLGIPQYDVVRDNGHRCRCCGTVLWVENGQAPFHCKQCQIVSNAASLIVSVIGSILSPCVDELAECVVCGSACVHGRYGKHTKTCSKACRIERGRRKTRERYERQTGVRLRPASAPRQCKYCDRPIAVMHHRGRGRLACDHCNLFRGDHKSRAIMYGVPYAYVSRVLVFERDGWRCQLCGRCVLRKARRRKHSGRLHPRTASLDHIIPMSRGGPHSEQNCQCACLECNVRKNARMIGQTRLF